MPRSQGEPQYSSPTGAVYVFNIIVGTGVLALPSSTRETGIIIAMTLLLILGLASFMTATFVIEALACANALTRKRYEDEAAPLVPEQKQTEESTQELPKEGTFDITEKYEIGQMGVLMTPKWCQVLIYTCLCIYLFGDLAIYEAVIGTTIAQIVCAAKVNESRKLSVYDMCFESAGLTVGDINKLSIVAFVLLHGPFVFFNLQKTRALQIISGFMRCFAFFTMLIWSIVKLSVDGAQGHPPVFEIRALPLMFGTSIYSYMCQHSLPGMAYLVRKKKHLLHIFTLDFTAAAVFYLALSVVPVFTYDRIESLYSLNFWKDAQEPTAPLIIVLLGYYLCLFPIFTLSTSFPTVGITLKNNLRALVIRDAPFKWYFDKLLFPLITILPPTILSLCVSDVQLLLGIIGSYCGAGVQYLIPCLLVQFARAQTANLQGNNVHLSPFKQNFWPYTVYVWMILSLILISTNYGLKYA